MNDGNFEFCDTGRIAAAARRLEAGELVAFPTETVYGLGADAENPGAVARIYAAKGRPPNHPVIVHLAAGADLSRWAVAIPEAAHKLVAAFWPGPLTLILKRHPHIPDAVSGGQDTVGLRCPAHPVAQALLAAFKAGQGGIAAPSANQFGHVSPTRAAHVRDEFPAGYGGPEVMVLEGGAAQVGIESTIVDLSRIDSVGPVLLRPGHLTPQQISAVVGMPLREADAQAPRASGTLAAHYAPRTPLHWMEHSEMADWLTRHADRRAAVLASQSLAGAAYWQAAPQTPEHYARDLYALLRMLDAGGFDAILVERLPATPEWRAVADRLKRAAAAYLG